MFCTGSLNVTVMLVKFVTVSPPAGDWPATVGAITLVGGIVITTVIPGDTPMTPWASDTATVNTLVPKGAVHTAAYGAAPSLPKATPLLKNCTLLTPAMALAVAVINKLVGPSIDTPSAGYVTAPTGVPTASYTTTATSADVVVAP